MAKSTGGGGNGGRTGGGGGGPDMTTPAKDMGLDTTISNIYKTRQAISAVQQEINSEAYQKAGWKETKPVREKLETLQKRQKELEYSIRRSQTGEKGNLRETLFKGKEKKDLGPWQGHFSAHYGPA